LKGSDQKSKFLLTHREREVFELLVQDKTTRDIAQQLFISEKTVRNHISNVMWFEIHRSKSINFNESDCKEALIRKSNLIQITRR